MHIIMIFLDATVYAQIYAPQCDHFMKKWLQIHNLRTFSSYFVIFMRFNYLLNES